jgi:hypothetical protein
MDSYVHRFSKHFFSVKRVGRQPTKMHLKNQLLPCKTAAVSCTLMLKIGGRNDTTAKDEKASVITLSKFKLPAGFAANDERAKKKNQINQTNM